MQVYTVADFSSKMYWYRVKIKDFPVNFICQSCRCIVPQLNTLWCGHWCCDVCLKGMRFREKGAKKPIFKCSLCRLDSVEVSMTTTVNKTDFERKSAACANNGCSFVGQVRDIKRHAPFCPETTFITCPNCAKGIQRAQMAHHLRVKCLSPVPLPTPTPIKADQSHCTSLQTRKLSDPAIHESCVTLPRRNPSQADHRRAATLDMW